MIKLLRKKKFILIIFLIFYLTINYSIPSIDFVVPVNVIGSKKSHAQQNSKILYKNSNGSAKINFLVNQVGNFGSEKIGVTKCTEDVEFETTTDESEADILFYHMFVPKKVAYNKYNKTQYSMVFSLESEAHSPLGDTWKNADFRMWYNLDLSYPAPVTYFDVKVYLVDLLSPAKVEFENKIKEASVVWIVSNCNAYNGRENYIKKLMSYIKIDSYGACLNNKRTHTADRMKGNIELYSRYKFVIAIENSNCKDYVSEKLVHAIGSGSIPIVAGKSDKPDYLRFIPKHSYINIYDYESPKKLADHIINISKNKTLYEGYINFKRNDFKREYLDTLALPELIKLANTSFYKNETFMKQLVSKEKSENKICKIVRYVANTDPVTIKKEIEKNKRNRPLASEACLPLGNLVSDFV